MSPQDLETAAEFCKLVESSDLLEYLGVPRTAPVAEIQAALDKKRRYLQGMQANPKFKESAKFLLKNYRNFGAVLQEPEVHLARQAKDREAEKLPIVEMAIDSILADGMVTREEEAFVRQAAFNLGISEDSYEALLAQKAKEAGVVLPDTSAPAGPKLVRRGGTEHHELAHSITSEALIGDEPTEERQVKGAAGHGWWDAAFTRLLLGTIPGGPAEMVDIYCRTALSAQTLLPERRQLTYLGVDRDPARLEQARIELAHLGDRLQLAEGDPDALPIEDASVDYVLSVRALANIQDTEPVFREAARVLRRGGRLVVAEPDGYAESFFFDGHLVEYNAAFHQLLIQVDTAFGKNAGEMGKSGMSLGPQLRVRLTHAGLEATSTAVHASHNLRPRPLGKFARRLRGYPIALVRAAGLRSDLPELIDVLGAVDKLERNTRADFTGLSGHVLPLFLCVGVKP